MTNTAFRRARSRRILAAAVGFATLVAVAGCSAEQEGAGSGGGGGTGAAEDCINAEEAQATYEESWSSVAEAFGLSELTPVEEEVCEVDPETWAAEPKQGDAYRIAFAAQGPTNSWGVLSEEAFNYHAEELGVDVLYAAANGDATQQVDNIQQLASQDPDAMVVVPMGEGIAGQVQAAVSQGIPVVLCSGILPESSQAVSTVTRQYDLLGTAYAEWIAQELGGEGQVAILSGLAGVPTAEYQKAAAEATFEKYPDIEVVTTQYTEWSPTVAKTVAQNLIASYPDLDAIWSDSGYGAIGVVQAYQEAGLPVPPITGDAVNDFLLATQGTDVRYALSTFPPEMSSTCLDTAMDLLNGEPVLNKVYIDSPSFTNEEGEQYVREDCDGGLLVPTSAPEDLLVELGMCQA
ncbi:substrate-binding domain-containing protein [Naasia sp. SYSU D00057]|uniref:substrate-binding domain-containing protein n=1 Tax=Naasia sp. SYSU D00057 TaxID=2817380 RepID=UPI001B30ECE8|nr:substrate-binding domain-containing protein [Naasia sp. SYSU D00057]